MYSTVRIPIAKILEFGIVLCTDTILDNCEEDKIGNDDFVWSEEDPPIIEFFNIIQNIIIFHVDINIFILHKKSNE